MKPSPPPTVAARVSAFDRSGSVDLLVRFLAPRAPLLPLWFAERLVYDLAGIKGEKGRTVRVRGEVSGLPLPGRVFPVAVREIDPEAWERLKEELVREVDELAPSLPADLAWMAKYEREALDALDRPYRELVHEAEPVRPFDGFGWQAMIKEVALRVVPPLSLELLEAGRAWWESLA